MGGYPVVKTVGAKTIVSPLHYYGKRSADAEPAADADADADPWLAYGHYGYGSTGHTDTDTAATTVDIPMEDTGPTDIPTTDKDTAARFLYGYLPRYYPNVFREPISKC